MTVCTWLYPHHGPICGDCYKTIQAPNSNSNNNDCNSLSAARFLSISQTPPSQPTTCLGRCTFANVLLLPLLLCGYVGMLKRGKIVSNVFAGNCSQLIENRLSGNLLLQTNHPSPPMLMLFDGNMVHFRITHHPFATEWLNDEVIFSCLMKGYATFFAEWLQEATMVLDGRRECKCRVDFPTI